jgi:hypothetical protein
MDRWADTPPADVPQCSIGVDVAQGGDDNTVLSIRYDGYFCELISVPGRETPEGSDVAALVLKHRRDQSHAVIDMGGGYGGSAYEHLRENEVTCIKYKGAESTSARTKNGSLPYYNTRAAAFYRLREALDPGQPGGQRITLPNDRVLMSELCSIRIQSDDINVIKLEPKKDLKKRIGKSPDRADAVAIAWFGGGTIATKYNARRNSRRPKVVTSKRNIRRR